LNLPWNRQHGITLQSMVTITIGLIVSAFAAVGIISASQQIRRTNSARQFVMLVPSQVKPQSKRNTTPSPLISDFLNLSSAQSQLDLLPLPSSLGSVLPLPVTLSNER